MHLVSGVSGVEHDRNSNHMIVWNKTSFVPDGSYHRDSATGFCDGSVCGTLCVAAKAHLARDPWQLSFTESPTAALDDQPHNNHPLLLLQRQSGPADSHDLFIDRLHKHVTGHDCPPLATPLPLSWSATVNHSFERLFGHSQRQVRSLFVDHHWLASFLLLDCAEWKRVVVEDMVAQFGAAGSGGGDRGWQGAVRAWIGVGGSLTVCC